MKSPSNYLVKTYNWCMKGHGFNSRRGLTFFLQRSRHTDYRIIVIQLAWKLSIIKAAGDKLLMNKSMRQNFGGGLTL